MKREKIKFIFNDGNRIRSVLHNKKTIGNLGDLDKHVKKGVPKLYELEVIFREELRDATQNQAVRLNQHHTLNNTPQKKVILGMTNTELRS